MLNDGHEFFPFYGQVEHLPLNSVDLAAEIVALTNKAFGLPSFLNSCRPKGWDEFVAAKITTVGFYKAYSKDLKTLVKAIIETHG